MDHVIAFFSNPFFIIFSGISTFIVLVTALYSIFLVSKGVLPVLWRLGYGLSRRKIAVFADSKFDDLKAMLVDSGLFKENNILKISKESIGKAEDISLLLMQWDAYKDVFQDILMIKNDLDALIVYAPQNEGLINDPDRDAINKQRNAMVVNFRGRLINDVLSCMMTTVYQKKR